MDAIAFQGPSDDLFLLQHQPLSLSPDDMPTVAFHGSPDDLFLLHGQPFFSDDVDAGVSDEEGLVAATLDEIKLIDDLLGQLLRTFYLQFPEDDDEWDQCSVSLDEEEEEDDLVDDDAMVGFVDEEMEVLLAQATILTLERVICRMEFED